MSNRYLSPLRYPGGKARMSRWIAELAQLVGAEVLIEPFAGGAGAGLGALIEYDVPELWLCEKNPAIFDMWRRIFEDTRTFADQVASVDVDMPLYLEAQAVLAGRQNEQISPGLAALIVNRCSRSGIVAPGAGPIGGRDQAGDYRLDARFSPASIAGRIMQLGLHGDRVRLIAPDGIEAIEQLADAGMDDDVLVFVDPPYLGVGDRLYAETMSDSDHKRLAAAVLALQCPWVATYNMAEAIRGLYASCCVGRFPMSYSAGGSKQEREFLIVPQGMPLPDFDPTSAGTIEWKNVGRIGRSL